MDAGTDAGTDAGLEAADAGAEAETDDERGQRIAKQWIKGGSESTGGRS